MRKTRNFYDRFTYHLLEVFDEKLPIRMKCYWDKILTTKIRLYLVKELERKEINLCSDSKFAEKAGLGHCS